MEPDNPMENDGDSGSGLVITDCLSLPEILRKIMQFFSTSELIELSAVSKLWNYEARSLMRSRGNLIARMPANRKCQDLEEFSSQLEHMEETRKVVPFSGMNITLGMGDLFPGRECMDSSGKELDQVYDNILNQVTWKKLSLTFSEDLAKHKSCPPFQLVTKILRMYCNVLEELSLGLIPQNLLRDNVQQFFQKCKFPRLKTLRFMINNNDHSSRFFDYSNLIKALVSIAPNLQVLYTANAVNLKANLLDGSSAIHVTDYLYYSIPDDIPEDIIGRLRIQRLKLEHKMWDFNLEIFNRITSALLQSSRTTLNFMSMDAIFLIPLMCYGIRLENVKDLEICLAYWRLERYWPHVLKLCKSFDFNHIFPNLSKISTNSSSCEYRSYDCMATAFCSMADEGNPAVESVPDRAINIKNLRLKWDTDTGICLMYPSIPFLAEMFPRIEKLSIDIGTHEILFAGILDSWVDLKELKIILSSQVLGIELESALCGLFPEEVALLRMKSTDYLKALNIVPVMPSIVSFKGLRTLKLVCDLRKHEYDPTQLLSKVTGIIAFKRCPHLRVNLLKLVKNLKMEKLIK